MTNPAPTAVSPAPGALLCRVGAVVCAVPLADVAETMRPLPAQPIAGVPGYVTGVAIVRGEPIPVVDARALLGASGAPAARRFVLVRVGARRVAVAVDAVVDVRALPAADLRELPPLLGDASDAAVASLGTLDAALVVVLRAARVVPASVWGRVDALRAQP